MSEQTFWHLLNLLGVCGRLKRPTITEINQSGEGGSQNAIRALDREFNPFEGFQEALHPSRPRIYRKNHQIADRSTDAVTQELEFHISVTPVGADKYLVRTERVAPGVPLAEEQVSWPVEEWLAQARQLMNDPLLNVLQGKGNHILGSQTDIRFAKRPSEGDRGRYSGGQGNLDPDLMQSLSASDTARSLNLVALGQQLYNSLFYGTLRDSWMTAQGIAQHRREVLRLRLGLKDNRVTRLPWEALHAGDRPIATGTDVVFSRYQPSKGVSRNPIKDKTLSGQASTLEILMVLAGPTDRENLELKREAQQLQQEIQSRFARNALNAPAMQLTILDQPDRATVTQALEQNKYQVFHYAGHSNLGVAGGELYLVSRRTGLTETVSGYDLAGLLANNGIQLAVFNSCRGAHTATSDPTEDTGERNLAEALVKRGIPAVLAMAERIPDDVALTLARLFYRNLNQGYAVDLSLSRARQGLISSYGSNQLYWALPILYLHPEFDGYLNTSDRASGLMSASAPENTVPPNRQPALPLPGILEEDIEERALQPSLDEFDEADIESVYDELAYDELSDPETSADFTKWLRQQLANANVSEDEPLNSLNREPLLPQQHPTELDVYRQPSASRDGRSQTPALSNQAGQSNPSYGQGIQKKPSVSRPGASKVRKNASNSRIQWIGALSLCAFAVLGLWSFRDLIFKGAGQPTDSLPSITQPYSTDENFNKIDLKKASPSDVVALAIAQFNKGNLSNGQRATQALLDRSALEEAKTALAAVPKDQEEDPEINFLRGRLAWQFIQTGNTDYSLQDVRRRWEDAVRDRPKSPLYYNALAFAYYADGDLNRASDAWLRVLTLLEEPPTTPAQPIGDRKPQATPTPMPTPISSLPNRDALTAYAGSALVLMKTAPNQPPTEQASRLSQALKLRQMVITKEPIQFQIEELEKNWMWPEIAIQDWRALKELK